MGFLSHVRQDLQASLADQQRLAVIAVLRKRFSTLTFDDLRHLLTSPLGKGLGPQMVADVFGAPPTAATAKPNTPNKRAPTVRKPRKKVPKSTPPRRARASRASGGTAKPVDPDVAQPVTERQPRRASKPGNKTKTRKAKRSTTGTRPVRDPAVATNREADPRPPGLSAEQMAEMTRYGEAVLAYLRQANDWISSSEIREHVGKSAEQLRLALRKLEASGDIVRTGERGNTRYKLAAR